MNIYTPSESFVYYWQNSQNNKIYLGSHKGLEDDGYTHTSSNKKFVKEFVEHPERFVRTIVAYGTWKDMRELEAGMLHFVDARKNPMYYNKSNGGATYGYDHSLPCTWEGNEYPSIKVAHETLGVHVATFKRWRKKGYSCMADVDRGNDVCKPCTWEGIAYPSVQAAAIALGVNKSTLAGWIQKGYTSMADVERGKAKGYKKIALGLQKPCTWEGIEYPSITAAAKALGVLVPTLWKWLQKGYTSFADRGNNE